MTTPSRKSPQIKEGPNEKEDTFQENASNQGRSQGKDRHLPGKRRESRKVPGEWATPSRKTPRIKEGPGRMGNTFQENASNQGRSQRKGPHLPGKGLESRKVPTKRPTPSRKTPRIKEGPSEKDHTFQENASNQGRSQGKGPHLPGKRRESRKVPGAQTFSGSIGKTHPVGK